SSNIIFRRWVTGIPPVTHTYINRRATNAPLPHAKRPPPGGLVQVWLWGRASFFVPSPLEEDRIASYEYICRCPTPCLRSHHEAPGRSTRLVRPQEPREPEVLQADQDCRDSRSSDYSFSGRSR